MGAAVSGKGWEDDKMTSEIIAMYNEQERKRVDQAKLDCPNCFSGRLERDAAGVLFCPECRKEVIEDAE
jgi:ribosomal protein L37AE/L43A